MITDVERRRAEAAYAAVGAKMELLDRKKEQMKKDFLTTEKYVGVARYSAVDALRHSSS